MNDKYKRLPYCILHFRIHSIGRIVLMANVKLSERIVTIGKSLMCKTTTGEIIMKILYYNIKV